MSNVRKFAAVNVKVRALEGQLLRDEDYQRLLMLDQVDDVVEYLRNETWYASILPEARKVDIIDLEGRFERNAFEKYEKLFHYFTDAYRDFFKVLMMRYEIENLKLFLRMIIRKESLLSITDHLIIPKIYSRLDYDKIKMATTVEELSAALAGTEYQALLDYYKHEEATKLMFYMEMNLDRLYFKKLSHRTEALDKPDRTAVGEVLGRNIDMLNIQWIYRGRRYYRLLPEEILNYTLFDGKYFSYKRLKEFCYMTKLEETEAAMRQSPYGFMFGEAEHFEVLFEIGMDRYLYKIFDKLRMDHPMSIIEPMVYLHRLEYEMRDLFTIVESKRYNISSDACRQFLIRELRGRS
jgi:V/A-type H+-transporting ATPase subunit C